MRSLLKKYAVVLIHEKIDPEVFSTLGDLFYHYPKLPIGAITEAISRQKVSYNHKGMTIHRRPIQRKEKQ